MASFRYHAFKIMGNFGASFLSPLMGAGVVNQLITTPIAFENMLIVAGVSSLIATSLSAFNELRLYGESSGISH